MKIATQTIEHEGNLQFEDNITMAIADDPRSMAIILRSLISAYKNPYLAALREYTSNANDSHREAGQTRPVEVTLPTALSPNLIIQDWGTGMDREQVIRYSQFGASNKRDSNDMIGGFGIGSKSGLAVSSQFTLTSVKDGKRNVAVIGYNAEGVPTMGLLPERDTTEPSGVKVSIPLTSSDQFGDVAQMTTLFWLGWEPNSIIVNGRKGFPSVHDTTRFAATAGLGWRDKNHSLGTGEGYFRATIGAVGYLVKWSDTGLDIPFALRRNYLSNLVIQLDNGSVDLTPSREELSFTKRTRNAIGAKIEAAIAAAKVLFQQEIDSAKRPVDALKAIIRATKSGLPHEGFTFKGKPVPDYSDFRNGNQNDTRVSIEANSTALIGYGNRRTSVSENDVFGRLYGYGDQYSILVTDAGHKGSGYSDYHHQSIQSAHYVHALIRSGAITTQMHNVVVYITPRKASDLDKWSKSLYDNIVDATAFEAAGLAHRKVIAAENRATNAPTTRVKGVRGRVVTHWSGRGYKAATDTKLLTELDTSLPYIILKNETGSTADQVWGELLRGKTEYNSSEIAEVLHSGLNKTYKVLLAAKNWDTSKYADVLTITTTEQVIKDMAVSARQTALTPAEQAALADRTLGGEWYRSFRHADLTTIVNPVSRAWVEALQDESLVRKNLDTLKFARVAQRLSITLPPAPGVKPGVGRVERYPMFRALGYNTVAAPVAIEYINLIDSIR